MNKLLEIKMDLKFRLILFSIFFCCFNISLSFSDSDKKRLTSLKPLHSHVINRCKEPLEDYVSHIFGSYTFILPYDIVKNFKITRKKFGKANLIREYSQHGEGTYYHCSIEHKYERTEKLDLKQYTRDLVNCVNYFKEICPFCGTTAAASFDLRVYCKEALATINCDPHATTEECNSFLETSTATSMSIYAFNKDDWAYKLVERYPERAQEKDGNQTNINHSTRKKKASKKSEKDVRKQAPRIKIE